MSDGQLLFLAILLIIALIIYLNVKSDMLAEEVRKSLIINDLPLNKGDINKLTEEATNDKKLISRFPKTKIDSKNDTYYKHGIEGCPDLADSIFLTPTSKNPWDPYEVFCKKNVGKFKHKFKINS